MADFLLEIGCEEIPARMIDAAREDLRNRLATLIKEWGLPASAECDSKAFSTPRRLGFLFTGLRASQPNMEQVLTGPAENIAYKNGAPTAAGIAFAKKAGVPVEQLEIAETDKGRYVRAKSLRHGKSATDLFVEFLPKEILAIYWPKSMYWRPGAPERFVRPIRWIVAMLDDEVIPLETAGVRAGSVSAGHRLLSKSVTLNSASDYRSDLSENKVVVDVNDRNHKIIKELNAACAIVTGARCRLDDELLDTVVNLTEWPSVILGSFDNNFLALPEELLVTVMRDHQKYFAVEDVNGKLLPHFLAVLNTDGDPEGLIRHGNERVLKARFNDAQFFWQTDQKIPLKQRIDSLKAVTFQKDLGSYYDKTRRVEKLAGWLAEELADSVEINIEAVADAAWLAKTDLTTELVKEFTELQGIIGGLYARAQGLDDAVAQAIYDQYKPESQEDAPPKTIEGAILSIADKADSIAGMFALGKQPTGSKDPFALRRQANGIVKTVAEHELKIGMRRMLLEALEIYRRQGTKFSRSDAEYEDSLGSFFRERLEFYLRDVRGFAYDVVSAVLAAGSDRVVDAIARATALQAVRSRSEFEAIALSFKRIKNILRQAHEKAIAHPREPDASLVKDEKEQALLQAAIAIGRAVEPQRAKGDYEGALSEIARLRGPLDSFFDHVMVMVDDTKLRANRLALLAKIMEEFSTIADFSEIVTERVQSSATSP